MHRIISHRNSISLTPSVFLVDAQLLARIEQERSVWERAKRDFASSQESLTSEKVHVCLCVCCVVYLSVGCLSVCLSFLLFYVSVCLCTCVSLCPSVCLSLSLSV